MTTEAANQDPPKEDPPKEDPPKKDDPPKADPPKGENGEGGINLDALAEKVAALLKKDDSQPVPKRQDIEEAARKMVEDAAQKLKEREDHEHDHETLRKQAAAVAEAVPKKIGKLQKLMWGSDE